MWVQRNGRQVKDRDSVRKEAESKSRDGIWDSFYHYWLWKMEGDCKLRKGHILETVEPPQRNTTLQILDFILQE